LAGITCGHFGIPFWRFFVATVIGKAIIKAPSQTAFVVVAFKKGHLDDVIAIIERYVPFLSGKLHPILEAQRKQFHHSGIAPVRVLVRARH